MTYQPPDGIARSDTEEQRLNEAFAAVFRDAAGEAVLQYLRSITIELVSGPGAVDGQYLAHMEGQRYLAGIIEARVELGKQKLPEVLRGTAGTDATGTTRRDSRKRRHVRGKPKPAT